jgi:STAS domain
VTYRIHQSVQRGANVFLLSGVLDAEHVARLEELLATAPDGRIVLDLKDITLVDRAAVQFLARRESAGAEMVNCPEYVRSWTMSRPTIERTLRELVMDDGLGDGSSTIRKRRAERRRSNLAPR